MNRLDNLLIGTCALLVLLVACWFGLHHFGAERYQDGYDAAVVAGKEARGSVEVAHVAIESGLRAQLLDRDTAALRKEQEYASNLDAAQRRVRAGDDRLRCPAAYPVQPAATATNRPAAAGPGVDGEGTELVPDAAAEVLGDGATAAGIVRKFDRLKQRFEACRAVNARP